MAMPTSACVSAGASLMPSPTMAMIERWRVILFGSMETDLPVEEAREA